MTANTLKMMELLSTFHEEFQTIYSILKQRNIDAELLSSNLDTLLKIMFETIYTHMLLNSFFGTFSKITSFEGLLSSTTRTSGLVAITMVTDTLQTITNKANSGYTATKVRLIDVSGKYYDAQSGFDLGSFTVNLDGSVSMTSGEFTNLPSGKSFDKIYATITNPRRSSLTYTYTLPTSVSTIPVYVISAYTASLSSPTRTSLVMSILSVTDTLQTIYGESASWYKASNISIFTTSDKSYSTTSTIDSFTVNADGSAPSASLDITGLPEETAFNIVSLTITNSYGDTYTNTFTLTSSVSTLKPPPPTTTTRYTFNVPDDNKTHTLPNLNIFAVSYTIRCELTLIKKQMEYNTPMGSGQGKGGTIEGSYGSGTIPNFDYYSHDGSMVVHYDVTA